VGSHADTKTHCSCFLYVWAEARPLQDQEGVSKIRVLSATRAVSSSIGTNAPIEHHFTKGVSGEHVQG
jgi:hypothetical protein